MNILKQLRRCFAAFFTISITLLFLDFTGSIHFLLGWTAKIQFIPALFALNFIVVAILLILTFVFGRLYCSVICPLGVFQDVVSGIAWIKKKNRFYYSHSFNILRWGFLALFILSFFVGFGVIVDILDPYSSFGVMVSNILSPIYIGANNILAYFAERVDSYAFYNKEIWFRGVGVLAMSIIIFFLVSVLAWKNGRTYCNTICPVGTFLGFISKFSLFRISIDNNKCNSCSICEKKCKSSCINSKDHTVDNTRCVTCFNCIGNCKKGAISYKFVGLKNKVSANEKSGATIDQVDNARRAMLGTSAFMLSTAALSAQEAKMDGGLAFIEDKKVPKRNTKIVPPGANNHRTYEKKCTACQLCVSVCPNNILQPSNELKTFMQPYLTYERGYCRPECNKCSQVCPTGAIGNISPEDKSSTQIGHAVWIEKNCVVLTDGVNCGNCERHCPVGAIQMITKEYDGVERNIPIIDTERCIGCGACENLCPSRPFSAIYVEGHLMHKTV